MLDKVLKSGRKVKIKELSIDQIDDLNDIPEIKFENGIVTTINNLNKAKTAWIRTGLGGGDYNDWKPNGVGPPDHILKQMSEIEKDELVDLIKSSQYLSKKKKLS